MMVPSLLAPDCFSRILGTLCCICLILLRCSTLQHHSSSVLWIGLKELTDYTEPHEVETICEHLNKRHCKGSGVVHKSEVIMCCGCRGGAIYSDGMIGLEMKGNPKVDFGHIVFKNNRASTGGGMYISVRNPESNEVVISNALVSGNIADKDFQVDYGLVEELAETIQEMNDEHDDGYGVKEMQEIDLAGCGLGGGGGLCLGLVSVPERALVKVEFVNSAFEKNRATNGGNILSFGDEYFFKGLCRKQIEWLLFFEAQSMQYGMAVEV